MKTRKPSEELLKVHGVLDTIVGYTGGTDATTAPSYESVCLGQSRWVEGVRVQYDDEQITYEMLLDGFFESQEPKQGSRQYASIIFPHDEEQDRVAQKWLREAHARFRSDGVYAGMTTIEPLSTFFKAEGYHQRYWQKMRPRIGAILALVALSSGTLDTVVPDSLQNSLHAVANGAGLFGCAYLMLERKLDARVVKI
jgi:methionine-S-sulfoxide reductase